MSAVALTMFTLLATADASISKRSLEDMARMVRARTGKSALDFNDYGNYCGLGGRGIPVDGIDSCCAMHDRCYSYLNGNGCFPYLVPYRYVIEGSFIYCLETGSHCSDITCRCDKDLADCVSNYPYNGRYKHLPDIRPLTENIIKLLFGQNENSFD